MDLQREQTLGGFLPMSSWKICLGQEQTLLLQNKAVYMSVKLCKIIPHYVCIVQASIFLFFFSFLGSSQEEGDDLCSQM